MSWSPTSLYRPRFSASQFLSITYASSDSFDTEEDDRVSGCALATNDVAGFFSKTLLVHITILEATFLETGLAETFLESDPSYLKS